MTQEEKQLLLADLCARLPYGVKVLCSNSYIGEISHIYLTMGLVYLKNVDKTFSIDEIKPYLRPMSSMTEEECRELGELPVTIENVGETLPNVPYYIEVVRPEQIDWFNAHHFDYHGLIPMGLALEAPEDLYSNESEYNENGWKDLGHGLKMDKDGHIAGGLKLK